MNYYTDRAISGIEDDLLGRASFAGQLGKSIYEYKGNESIVIGLYGEWGCGKTSVANMALQTVESLAKSDKKKLIVLRFSPWNYSNQDNLISQFLSLLSNRIKGERGKLLNEVGDALKKYSDAFEIASLIPVMGSIVAVGGKTASKTLGELLSKRSDLDSAKNDLDRALTKAKQKIVVLIDDIDRLTNPQIRDIIQLVKQVGDLPNIMYILAMDRDVVGRALSDVHGIDGNVYLEKIIQISFEIPALNKSTVQNIFLDRLESVLVDNSISAVWDETYWKQVFNNCINPYILNLRDVNRIINNFQFRYCMIWKETSFEDMLAISTLEVMDPKLYKWIRCNQYRLCEEINLRGSKDSTSAKTYKLRIKDEYNSLGIDVDRAFVCLSTLFPNFARAIGDSGYLLQREYNIRRQMRIAQKDRFFLYFNSDLENVVISRQEVKECLFDRSEAELDESISEINNNGHILYFMDEMNSLIDQLSEDRIQILCSVLIKKSHTFRGEKAGLFTFTAYDVAREYVGGMLGRIKDANERFDLLRNIINSSDEHVLGTIAHFIWDIEWAYGRLGSQSEDDKKKLVSEDHLKDLENSFVISINRNKNKLLDAEDFQTIFHMWEYAREKDVKEYIDKLFEDDKDKLRFICHMATRWTGTTGKGWKFHSEYYSKYITAEEVYNLIDMFGKKNIDAFADEEQIKLASFVMNYHREEIDMFDVNEDQAREKINEWKKLGCG